MAISCERRQKEVGQTDRQTAAAGGRLNRTAVLLVGHVCAVGPAVAARRGSDTDAGATGPLARAAGWPTPTGREHRKTVGGGTGAANRTPRTHSKKGISAKT